MPPVPSLQRRTTIALAALAGVSLAACDIDPPAAPPAVPGASEPPEDADLVEAGVQLLEAAAGLAAATADVVADPASTLGPLAAAHAAHASVLSGSIPDAGTPAPPPTSVPRRRRPALVAVRRSERRLLRQLEQACTEAASGDLARVLASIAASTAQHLVSLDAEVVR